VCGLVYLFVINNNVRRQAISGELIQSSDQGHFQFEGMRQRHGVLCQKSQIHSSLEVVVGCLWWGFFCCLVRLGFFCSLVVFFKYSWILANRVLWVWGKMLSYNGWGTSCSTNTWRTGKLSYLFSWTSLGVQVTHKALLLCISKTVFNCMAYFPPKLEQ